MTKVKICSVQEAEHILAAAESGANFVGLNFVPGVRRRLPEDKAREMVQAFRDRYNRTGPRLVGIFVDQPLDEVDRILQECDLDMAQLSGHESLEYAKLVSKPVIKAVHVPAEKPAGEVIASLRPLLAELDSAGVLPLLHPDVGQAHGGTGAALDWEIARALAGDWCFLLAGGLDPENVAQAVGQVQPWGVDVSSGVETAGIKDVEKIEAFVQRAGAAKE